jgi:hypothetical protein
MKKNLKIIIVALIIIAVVVVLVLVSKQKFGANVPSGANNAEVPAAMLEEQSSEAAAATQQLINEASKGQETKTIQVSEAAGEMGSSTVKEIKMVVVSPGTSGINVETGKVITNTGAVVENTALAGSQAAPQQSYPMESAKDLPSSTIKLTVTSSAFSPNEFTVNRGQAVSLAVTNINTTTYSEVFRFDDSSLEAVVLGLAKGQTKTITFNAPTKAGEYVFFSDMFDHRAQGAVGKMIVK